MSAVWAGLFGLLAVVVAARLTAGESKTRQRKRMLDEVQILAARGSGLGQQAKDRLQAKLARQMDEYLKPELVPMWWKSAIRVVALIVVVGLATGLYYAMRSPLSIWAKLGVGTLAAALVGFVVHIVDRRQTRERNRLRGYREL